MRDAIVREADLRRGEDCSDVSGGDLMDITSLNLGNKKIRSLQLGDFDKLSLLKSLYLYENPLDTLPAGGLFKELGSLTYLDLSELSGSLTTLPELIFWHLAYLERLDLNDSGLEALPLVVFGDRLTYLIELDLGGNDLATLPPGIFKDLDSLTRLRLVGNPLYTLPPGVFEGLDTLTGLDPLTGKIKNGYGLILGEHQKPTGNRDMNTHLINVKYSGLDFGSLTGYGYLQDYDDAVNHCGQPY